MYAKIANNEIVQYPADPRTDNPNVGFPNNWGGGTIDNVEYILVNQVIPPNVNLGWSYTESTPVIEGDRWVQTWDTNLKPFIEIKTDISNHRYNVEVGGVKIANNLYSTDRESQTKYVAVAVDISQSNVETWSINWKTADNKFVNLNATQMSEVINGVRSHVQACYDKEFEYHQLIETANQQTLESTDFSAGWPSNE